MMSPCLRDVLHLKAMEAKVAQEDLRHACHKLPGNVTHSLTAFIEYYTKKSAFSGPKWGQAEDEKPAGCGCFQAGGRAMWRRVRTASAYWTSPFAEKATGSCQRRKQGVESQTETDSSAFLLSPGEINSKPYCATRIKGGISSFNALFVPLERYNDPGKEPNQRFALLTRNSGKCLKGGKLFMLTWMLSMLRWSSLIIQT